MKDSRNNLRWFCEDCDKAIMSSSSAETASNCDKIDKLVVLVERLVEKLADVHDQLNDKCDRRELNNLETGIMNLEERTVKGNSD